MKINIALALFAICSTGIAQDFALDTSKSSIRWVGKELTTTQHYGSLQFDSGTLRFEDEKPHSGQFVVDMTTIKDNDLPEGTAERLEGHLKSDDFFSVAKHPKAILTITGADAQENGSFRVNADLTIKGITHPAVFDLIPADKYWIANLVFDRSKYNVRFRSGTFFQNLGDKLILDDIELETQLFFKQ
ncbi:MAG TPA: YceI family protein [Flavobacteriaceae bacterium]|nr:YceI family protein [Flavobacteriaceae bacterium]|tara:strand:- start:5757 stop:6320 length:564 start_codon:yes stop_codon:yes gene_type:complete